MPRPYSYELRQKAIASVERGEKKTVICRILNISRNTLDLWLKRKNETGDFAAINNESGGKEPKIKNWVQFEQFVLKHNHKTQIQIAELWGDNLTQQNVSKACQKLDITRKKNLRVRRKR